MLYSTCDGLYVMVSSHCQSIRETRSWRHGGSASLCRVEWKNKMAATYNVLACSGDEFYTSKDT